MNGENRGNEEEMKRKKMSKEEVMRCKENAKMIVSV